LLRDNHDATWVPFTVIPAKWVFLGVAVFVARFMTGALFEVASRKSKSAAKTTTGVFGAVNAATRVRSGRGSGFGYFWIALE
jgi:hypothetical protein